MTKINDEQDLKKMIEHIYNFVYALVKSKEIAEDITSQTFIKADKNQDRFKGGSYRNWLFTIAHNLVIDYYRKNNRLSTYSEIEEKNNHQVFYYTHSEDINKKILIDQVYKALDHLKVEYKTAVILHYIYGYKYAELAKIMNKNENAIRKLVSRAIHKIRLYIKSDKQKRKI